MEQVTLGLAVLLGAGLLFAQIGKRLHLPSVTGYILAGLCIGPSGLELISPEIIGTKLNHFTHIALMMIAFGIGEHIEIKEVRKVARSVGFIGIAETSGAFIFVCLATLGAALLTQCGPDTCVFSEYVILALLLGAVSIATAPAATLHVMREMNARGPLTSTLMAVVAVDDGLAIMFFGISISIVSHIIGNESTSIISMLLMSGGEIIFSLLLGILTGLLIDFTLHRLRQRGEMLSAGLALLLLCGEGARLMHLSPLLAGMAAGFTIVNRDKRDVRLFRVLRDFEPPIYILFFTLAGAHLNLSALGAAGWIGLAYFLARMIGKILGAGLGAKLAKAPQTVQKYLGLALTPQAGVAIGLVFLISNDADLHIFSVIITPVVLAGVILSELTGPLCARLAIEKAGEGSLTPAIQPETEKDPARFRDKEGFTILPWTWEKLVPPKNQGGVVLFGTSHSATAPGLARMATIFAHHFSAAPMSVRIAAPSSNITDPKALFLLERTETSSLGYTLKENLIKDDDVAHGLISAITSHNTKCVVLGYPIEDSIQGFQYVVESVAENAVCPVVVIRFCGILHTERILVPLVSMDQLDEVGAIVTALSKVGEHSITLLYLLPYDYTEDDQAVRIRQMKDWIAGHNIYSRFSFKVISTEARLETINTEALRHDLIVMGSMKKRGIQKLFFGSLAEAVAKNCPKPLLIVNNPG